MENEIVKQEKWYQSMTVKMVLLGILGLMLTDPARTDQGSYQGTVTECRDSPYRNR